MSGVENPRTIQQMIELLGVPMTMPQTFLCLCCDQPIKQKKRCKNPEAAWALLDAMGYTREDLLGKYLANIDFTQAGLSDWLREQP
jgi:hypothetical protein